MITTWAESAHFNGMDLQRLLQDVLETVKIMEIDQETVL
jgi:hypothetical protein